MISKLLIGTLCSAMLLSAADTRLADAAMQGDRETVRSLLKQKADVNAAQGDGSTALHWAAFKDDLEMAKLLLEAGANVHAVTREGAMTPLFMACTNGNAALIEALLKGGAFAASTKSNGTTALMIAAASGSADAVKTLLDNGANLSTVESVHGQTALMFAAALNRAEVVKLLMKRGADASVATKVSKLERVTFDVDGNVVPNAPARAEGPLPPALQAAVEKAAGLPPGAAGKAPDPAANGGRGQFAPRQVGPSSMGGMTALLYAARDGQMDAARELVTAGAKINQASGDNITPIVMAIVNGHLDLAKMLLDHGADPNIASETGITPLYAAIDVQWAPHAWFPQPVTEQEKVGYLDLMKALLERGANINAQLGRKIWFRSFTHDVTWIDPAGATAFWRAAQSTDIAAMRLLIEHHADPNIKSTAGATPLMAAAGIGWGANFTVNAPGSPMPAVKYCVELGNDLNAADNRGYTALHGAAYIGNNEMVNFLVEKGAKVDVKTKTGDTVADMANGPTRFGIPHPETVALLEKLGSANSHNCRSDQCLVAPREDNTRRATPAPVTPPPATKPGTKEPGTKEPGKGQ